MTQTKTKTYNSFPQLKDNDHTYLDCRACYYGMRKLADEWYEGALWCIGATGRMPEHTVEQMIYNKGWDKHYMIQVTNVKSKHNTVENRDYIVITGYLYTEESKFMVRMTEQIYSERYTVEIIEQTE